ncbi:MAG: addiction module antidote protein, HigA family [Flammeovirgaceae bacterium]|nr:addiction module antidote protein, HigA family [Flammeovirgaceae bacterium]MBR08660.1 addiction module antidote protein, HigA family [Rickettsiales bacterium]HCX24122.1 addiction module antidote protein, HigA family [Cytophagales bacterium]|tara:strand:+ start:5653 stop:6135 length:483 start_codon:yes stop_codon:yes gene_type:complete
MENDLNNEVSSGVFTEPMDSGKQEFDQFQAIILNRVRNQTLKQKRIVELMGLKFKMEDYLTSKHKGELKLAGEFLKAHLNVLKIQQNKFAHYIGLRPSNLSKVIKGERPLNSEMALILGKLFNQDPMIWLDIQTKNELIRLSKSKAQKLKKYKLDDLVEH